MKQLVSIIIIFLGLGCATDFTINPVQLPSLASPGQKGYIKSEFIFPIKDRPTRMCHSSTIEETSTGLVASWFGGSEEGSKDVGIWVSRLIDGKWSKPLEVANGGENTDRQYPCWNPVLFQPRHGPLLLFFKVGPSPRKWWGEMMSSEDGGKTWINRRRLGNNQKVGSLIGPVKNKPIQLSDGTFLCGASTEYRIFWLYNRWRVHFEITRDLGDSWKVIAPINNGYTIRAIQPSFLLHPNDQIQIVCRSRENAIVQSWSYDRGLTWKKMTPTSLPNPNSGLDSVTLKDGRHLIVYNHTGERGSSPSGRAMLNVTISNDGINWKPLFTVEQKKHSSFSYPAVIQSNDGMVHITYTYNKQSIKHIVLNPEVLN